MAYRFAIIPAGVADSAEVAAELVAEMRAKPRGRPPDAIAAVLGALENSPAGTFTVGCRRDSRGVFLSAPHPETGLLEALLLLTKDRFLAVYDLLLHRLYDPTDRVDVDVTLPGVRLPYLTRELLAELVSHPQWPDPAAPYLIVDRAEQDFIQAWRGADLRWQLEYREGGAESHFEAKGIEAGQVVALMWAWSIGDEGWRTAVDWQFLEIEDEQPEQPVAEPDSVCLQDERRDDGSSLSMTAGLAEDGRLEISGHDLGPVAAVFDGEYEWWYVVAADDVPALATAFGAEPGEGILGVLQRRFSGPGAYQLGDALRASGVTYKFHCWP